MAGKKVERFGKFFLEKCKYFFLSEKKDFIKISIWRDCFCSIFLNFSINTSAEDKRGQQEQVHGD